MTEYRNDTAQNGVARPFLDGFNDMQKEAILDFDDNLLILACAGSGKTRTITGKIAYAISEGLVDPWQICAVTFTNKAAGEMRDRLQVLVPDGADHVTVRTFHSLGVMLLRRFGDRIDIPKGFVIADDTDSAHFVKSALKLKGKNAGKLARETSGWILDAKEHGCMQGDPKAADYFHLDDVEYGNDADQMEWNEIFDLYEQEKKDAGALDFPDLIAYAVKLVEDSEEAREWCHRRYRMVLVDEYQDSNIMQARFLKSFVAEDAQLTVVGDDDQSIYSFRGAVVDNILNFPNEFKRVREVRLEKNYRSTGEILEAADSVIRKNTKRYMKEIVSAEDLHGIRPALRQSRNAYVEALQIYDLLDRLQPTGESCAVLYRQHKCAATLKKLLLERRIPFKVSGGQGVLGAKVVKDAMALLRLCINPCDIASLHRVISASRIGLGENAYRKLAETDPDVFKASGQLAASGRSSKGFATLHDVLCELALHLTGDDHGGPLPPKEEPPTAAAAEDEDVQEDEVLSDGELLKESLRLLGIAVDPDEEDDGSGTGADDPLEVYASMLNRRRDSFDPEMADDYTGGDPTPVQVLQSFLCRSELGDDMGTDKDEVLVLSTMHAAKGLEWDNVFLIGLEDEVIPGRVDSDMEEEEERRIFYVAMTRARKRLWMFTKQEAMMGKMGMKMCSPSRFLDAIPTGLLDSTSAVKRNVGFRGLQRPSVENASVQSRKPADNMRNEAGDGIRIGDRVEYPGHWIGTAIAEENYMGRRVISVKTEAGGIVKIVEGMGRFVVTRA